MSRLRKTIAKRMVESLQVSAQLTATVEVDLTVISRIRARFKDDFKKREGASLSYLPFITKAAVEALKVYPKVNATIDTEAGQITYPDAEHVGIAVDTEKGLLVPVIKDAGDLNIAGLAKKIGDLAARTRQNKVTPDELSGGTFTITNYGSAGTLMDTPIINQPQVAILGTGALVKRPVVIKDPNLGEVIAVRDMMYLSMSYDHRLVDGAEAARFLSTLKARLEEGDFALRIRGLSRTSACEVVVGRRIRLPGDGAAGTAGHRRRTRSSGWSAASRPPRRSTAGIPTLFEIDTAALDGVDAVVNLCGVGVANWLWTPRAGNCCAALGSIPAGPWPTALADRAAAGAGAGADPGRRASRSTAPHPSTVPHTEDVAGRLGLPGSAGPRVGAGRGPGGGGRRTGGADADQPRPGPFGRVLPADEDLAWSLGGGAVLGGGQQRMPMISLEDYLRFVIWAAENERASGPYNLTIPEPTTNVEFSDVLAAEVHRPRLLRAPAAVLRVALGELAEQLVGDMNVVPRRSLEQGFHFAAPDVRATVRAALHLDSAT